MVDNEKPQTFWEKNVKTPLNLLLGNTRFTTVFLLVLALVPLATVAFVLTLFFWGQ